MCQVVAKEIEPGLLRLTLDLKELSEGLLRGASVAVSGVCLTAIPQDQGRVLFEVMQETMDKTTLTQLEVGSFVNVERSVRVGDEIGGHRVSGHVSDVGTIRSLDANQGHVITISCLPAWMDYILPKGFVSLDGCSLTVVDVGPDWFTVSLIPETLRITTFGVKGIGDKVNIEIDPETQAIVATVKRYLDRTKTS